MVWFKGFLRSQSIKVDFAVSPTPHAVSQPRVFVPGCLPQMAFLRSCTWREGVTQPAPLPDLGQGLQKGLCLYLPQAAVNVYVVLVCAHCALSVSQPSTAFDTEAQSQPPRLAPREGRNDTHCASVPMLSLLPAASALSGEGGRVPLWM